MTLRASVVAASMCAALASALPGQRNCPPVRLWTPTGTVPAASRTISTVFYGLQSMWRADTPAMSRDLSRFLVTRPSLLGTLSAAVRACGRSKCDCPRPPQMPMSLQYKQSSELLVSGLRADSAGTVTGASLFLSEHPTVVLKLADSVALRGSVQQKSAIRTSNERIVRALARPPD